MSGRVLPDGWREVTLGESLELLLDHRGKTPTKLGGEFSAVGVPVVSALSVANGRLDLEGVRFVDSGLFGRWMPEPLRRGDVLLTSEAPLGRVALVPSDEPLVLGQRLFGLRGRAGVLDSRFLSHWLQSAAGQSVLKQQATGSTVVGIRQSALRELKIAAPAYGEQRAIAEVLGALDDKIAANRRAASLARQLTAAKFAEVVFGLEPSSRSFDEIARVGGGGTPKTGLDDYWDGEIPWLTPTDVTALDGSTAISTTRTLTAAGLQACASPLYPEGTIFMTSRATIGAMAVAGRPMAVNQGFIAVQPPEGLRWWLFHEMQSRVDEFASWANGATFLELSRGTFRRLPVRMAASSEVAQFETDANALHASEAASLAEAGALAATRDALLPALMSGRLTVRGAERVVTDAT